MKKRFLAFLLTFAMIFSSMPLTAFAEEGTTPGAEEPTTVKVNFTAQAEGSFLCTPQFDVEVSSDLAEKYGYSDNVENGVSALDVLVRAHEIYADSKGIELTKENISNYLVVSNGSVGTLFGYQTMANGFILDGMFPHDGTKSEYGGYNGTTVATQKVENGNTVEFFVYQDRTDWSDANAWFEYLGQSVTEITAAPDADLYLTLKSSNYMNGYQYADLAEMHANGSVTSGAQLAWVNMTDGKIEIIKDAVTAENGRVIVKSPDKEGTYYLTACKNTEYSPLIMSLTKIVVSNSAPKYGPCDLTSLSVTDLDHNPNALEMAPAFSSNVNVYAVPEVAYNSLGFLYVKAYAPNPDAVITAKCNEKTVQIISNDSWTLMFGALKGNEDNILTVTVAASADENAKTKTYQVTIPMAQDPETIPSVSFTKDLSEAGVAYIKNAEADKLTVEAVYKIGKNVQENAEIEYQWYSNNNNSTEGGTPIEGANTAEYTPSTVELGSTYYYVIATCEGVSATSKITKVNVQEDGIIHNIAKAYANDEAIANDGNYPWIAADMAAYAKAFPDTEYVLSDAQKQALVDKLINMANTTSSPSNLSKVIIALRAMGYDARNVITIEGNKLDIVKKLTDLIDAQNKSVTNYFTLPYVLIALQQGNDYATQEQIDYLLNAAIDSASDWQSTKWGPDAASAMILALAPYYNKFNEELDCAIEAGANAIKLCQDVDTGAIGNACSTGLAIAALEALGQNTAELIKNNGKNLLDGLLTYATYDNDGFYYNNSMKDPTSTEQGFRGLVGHALGGRVYDFKDMPSKVAEATWYENCPVRFNIVPGGEAEITVTDSEGTPAVADKSDRYDLTAGTYNYTVKLSGYKDAQGSFEVSEEEAENHTAKTINVSLVSKPNDSNKNISVHVKVLTHDADECNGEYTYKHNKSKYTVKLVDEMVTIKSGQTAFDAFALAMEEAGVDYVEKSDSYIVKIGDLDEMAHGPNSGWLYMVNGKAPDVACRGYKLTSDCEMIWFYTDDYTKDYGSEDFMDSSNSNNDQAVANKVIDLINAIGTVDKNSGEKITAARTAYDKLTDSQKKLVTNYSTLTKAEADFAALNGGNTGRFVDVPADHWAADAIDFVVENNLFQGTSDTTFEPETAMNRAMLVTVLWRLEGKPAPATDGKFSDVEAGSYYADAVAWANENGIVTGYENAQFGPEDKVTREQMAAVFARYAEYKGYDISQNADLSKYADAGKISAYAKDSLEWANAVGLITGRTTDTLAPQGDSTRAEVATMFWRFVNNIVK